ncbi:MAG: M23 family metallopeptidase [Candidatus Gracilibacteria bacterium]|nr:M23 family metallopeptidase [Candidatus Gracilibacteria bacterium]
MNKKIFIIFIIFSNLINNFSFVLDASALTNEQRKNILDNFENEEKDNIFKNSDFIDSDTSNLLINASRKVDVYSTLQSKTEMKRQYLEEQNQEMVERVATLESSINSLDKDIEDKISEVNLTNYKIIKIKKEISEGTKAIDDLTQKIKSNREVLLDYITHIYKKGNFVFDESNDIDNIKGIILNGEDIGELLNDMYFKSMLEITGQKLIDKHREYVQALYLKKVELEANQKELITLRNNLMLEKKVLDDKKEYKKKLLEITKGKEELYKKYIAEKIEIERSIKLKQIRESIVFQNTKSKVLKQYNCEYVDVYKNIDKLYSMTEKCVELNKIIYGESKLQKLDNITLNPFKWPVTPEKGISAYFNDEEYKEDIGGEHNAVDIVIPQGSSVKAAGDGYVIYLELPDSENYAYLAIKHSDGFVTVYGHLNEILVKQYDFVKEGEIIAKSGGEFGTKGAGLLTTGPHLHFELFQNQEFVDPLDYLDTTSLNYASLPEKYRYKFNDDFKAKYGYEYSLVASMKSSLNIKGDTEVERQKDLLNKYAIGGFRDWNLWVEESLDGNIDPTFVMCIGIAETGLGRHTKTSNNVGNVGNTDSGATKTMITARGGIRAIVNTLNNKYLSKYTEIQQLSRYGNKAGSIYASSDLNWHKNVTKCMSAIKQKYVSDDYLFRLYN